MADEHVDIVVTNTAVSAVVSLPVGRLQQIKRL